jgi:hypothetical protein
LFVSGNTTIFGGAANAMGGGKPISTLTSTRAIVCRGTPITNAKSIVPKNALFNLLPPFADYIP